MPRSFIVPKTEQRRAEGAEAWRSVAGRGWGLVSGAAMVLMMDHGLRLES